MRRHLPAGRVWAAALAPLLAIGAASVLAVPGAAAAARAAPSSGQPATGTARLQGSFLLTGQVTVAQEVLGERRGQKVTRTWTFAPTCPAGACATVALLRARAGSSDKVTLHRRAPGYYTGAGSFYAPLRCGSSTYMNGEKIPFTITVRITAAKLAHGAVVATQLAASYANRSRTNLTPCFAILGHDAATYTGRLA